MIPDFLKKFITSAQNTPQAIREAPRDLSGLIRSKAESARMVKEFGKTKVSPYPDDYSITSPTNESKNEVKESAELQAIRKYFPEEFDTAKAIFTQESQLGKFNQNLQGAPAYGLGQVYLPTWRDQIPGETDEEKILWLSDPFNNMKLARQIYDDRSSWDESGWNAWDAYKSGAYKEYL